MTQDESAFAASALLACARRVRAIASNAASQIAAELDAHDLWAPENCPPWAIPAPADLRDRPRGLLNNFLELVEESFDHGKLAESMLIVAAGGEET